jgi:hypothetical protein
MKKTLLWSFVDPVRWKAFKIGFLTEGFRKLLPALKRLNDVIMCFRASSATGLGCSIGHLFNMMHAFPGRYTA